MVQRFSAVIMRIRDPRTTALIFRTGKMVVTGAKSKKDSHTASRKYARIIQKLGFADVKFKEYASPPSPLAPPYSTSQLPLPAPHTPNVLPCMASLTWIARSLPANPPIRYKVQNMVGSCDVKFPIRLEGLHYNQQPFSQYEPEMFPGLIYKMVQPKVVLLIFVR